MHSVQKAGNLAFILLYLCPVLELYCLLVESLEPCGGAVLDETLFHTFRFREMVESVAFGDPFVQTGNYDNCFVFYFS